MPEEAQVPPTGVRADVEALAREAFEIAKTEQSPAMKAFAEKLRSLARRNRGRDRCPQCGQSDHRAEVSAARDRMAPGFRLKLDGDGVIECAHPWHDAQEEA